MSRRERRTAKLSRTSNLSRNSRNRTHRESETESLTYQLKLIIEQSPSAVAMFDKDMKYIWLSNRWISDFRLQDKECIGKSHYEIFPEIPERWKEIHQRCLNGASEMAEEDRFDRVDG